MYGSVVCKPTHDMVEENITERKGRDEKEIIMACASWSGIRGGRGRDSNWWEPLD